MYLTCHPWFAKRAAAAVAGAAKAAAPDAAAKAAKAPAAAALQDLGFDFFAAPNTSSQDPAAAADVFAAPPVAAQFRKTLLQSILGRPHCFC